MEEFIYTPTDKIQKDNPADKKVVKVSTYLIAIASLFLVLATMHDFYEEVENPEMIKYRHRYRYMFKGVLFLVLSIAILIIPNKDIDLKLLMGLAMWYSFRYLLSYTFVVIRKN